MVVVLLFPALIIARSRVPHILMVVADDFGWNDIGYHQNAVSGANPEGLPTTSLAAGLMRTPTLDRLASEGVKLESYYVQPLCSPTRSTIMTGRYPHHTGIGPDVIEVDHPYGVPAREVFLPELLRRAGYACHAVGKWHLGTCDEGYLPTERGFDSYVGYLAGGSSYYNHAADFRNGTNSSALGAPTACVGSTSSVNGRYSAELFASEAARIAVNHNASKPLFLYLAMQNVHNPYDVPPIDVNHTYPEILEYERRVYAGMVAELDTAVANVTAAFEQAGLWQDTLFIFTTDNGAIGYGSNYPLRGQKVMMWEGGIRGVAFVRGSDNANTAPLPHGAVSLELAHSTDWLPTLCRLAGVSPRHDGGTGLSASRSSLQLDGVDQWDVLASGGARATNRTEILHAVVQSRVHPTRINTSKGEGWSTSTCLDAVDRTIEGGCHPFGIVGGALRMGHLKYLFNPPNLTTLAGLESNVPTGVKQYTKKGFVPVTNDTVPISVGGEYLFNISADPTESVNLAANPIYAPDLARLRARYAAVAAAPNTIINLGWRFAFRDPDADHHPGRGSCMGPFVGSKYCPYGRELACFVRGSGFTGGDVGHAVSAIDAEACQAVCLNTEGCAWFVWRGRDATCHLKSMLNRTHSWKCVDCQFGPAACPT